MIEEGAFGLNPQSVQQDSSKKSSDILPFAPFIKPQQKGTEIPASVPQMVNKKEKKEVKPITSLKPDSIKKIDSFSSIIADSSAKKDSLVSIITESIPSDSGKLIQNTGSTFRFNDDDTVSFYPSSGNEGSALDASKILSPHLLPPSEIGPQPFYKPIPDWFSIILFIVLAAFTTIKVFYSRIFNQLFKAFVSPTVTYQVVRDENVLLQRATVMLSVIFYLIGALFLYQLSMWFNWHNNFAGEGFSRFLIFALFLSAVYSFKMLFLKVMSFVFNIDRAVATYIFTIFLINNVTGIILIPLVAAIAFMAGGWTDALIKISLFSVAGALLYRLIRGFGIGMGIPHFSIFYLILYFCTLEIAPLLVIFKLAGV